MKIVYIWILAYLMAYAAPIDIAPKLKIYSMPNALTSKIDWRSDTQLYVSSLGLWISAEKNIYRLDKPSKALTIPLHVSSFTLAKSAHPVAIVDEQLGLINHGFFLPSLKLPMAGYSLAAGPNDTLYLYNSTIAAPIYHFDGNMITPMALPSEAVQALTYAGSAIIFATKEGIFSLESGKPLGLIMPLPDFATILSIAVNPDTAELFVSTHDTVYSLNNGLMTPLVTGVGGAVAFYDNCLWIADSLRQQVYIIMPNQLK
ncbi:hypothetical protein KJ870_08170 [bacterium]|nr:hypothetical protein [bacterium]MBU1434896.1 hypothetical protein [bacterium]MBU1504001.1 hypothetical protein [bacterium]